MMLTKKTLSLSRTRAIGFALATSLTFGMGAVLMHSLSLQARAETPDTAKRFGGTWHWMFDGKRFVTMILVPRGSDFTGSVTGSRIALDETGGLLRADPSDDPAPQPIASAKLEGSAVHVKVKDGFEFLVRLKDDTHAAIQPVGAPPNMKPIPAQKVH